jgi:hypothetical protein
VIAHVGFAEAGIHQDQELDDLSDAASGWAED